MILMASMLVVFSCECRKSKPGGGETVIRTIALEYTRSTSSAGGDYVFKVQFEKAGEVVEYGIVYKAWITDESDKTPILDGSGTTKIVFGTTPPGAGVTDSRELSISFSNFNDVNYRAYAKLSDGSVVYGDVLYHVVA